MSDRVALSDICNSIDSLLVYTSVRDDYIVDKLHSLAHMLSKPSTDSGDLHKPRKALYQMISVLSQKAELYGLQGNVFKKYVIGVFLNDENAFSLASEKKRVNRSSSLFKLALQDMSCLLDILSFDLDGLCKELGKGENFTSYIPNNPEDNSYIEQIEYAKSSVELIEAFSLYYNTLGCGIMAEFKAFRFNGERLEGIQNCDGASFNDIIGYEEQKQLIIDNTEAFLNGAPANNVLLIGARGTGKSSCVKALLNEYHEKGLRIVEVSKDQLEYLPKITKLLTNRGKYFILFIDDLSFDEFEVQYKYMKSLLEGGIEKTPPNVLFYATSNRRHIIKEVWADKAGSVIEDGEVHASDAVNEKLSLSDRFGLTVSFAKPSPGEYFAIVKELTAKAKLGVPEEILKIQSKEWELTHHGLSGRSAKQFVNHLICEMNK